MCALERRGHGLAHGRLLILPHGCASVSGGGSGPGQHSRSRCGSRRWKSVRRRSVGVGVGSGAWAHQLRRRRQSLRRSSRALEPASRINRLLIVNARAARVGRHHPIRVAHIERGGAVGGAWRDQHLTRLATAVHGAVGTVQEQLATTVDAGERKRTGEISE